MSRTVCEHVDDYLLSTLPTLEKSEEGKLSYLTQTALKAKSTQEKSIGHRGVKTISLFGQPHQKIKVFFFYDII